MEIQSRETKPKQQQEDIIYRTKKQQQKNKRRGQPHIWDYQAFLPIWISRSPFAPSGPRLPFLFSSDGQPEIVPTGRTERRSKTGQGLYVSETEKRIGVEIDCWRKCERV